MAFSYSPKIVTDGLVLYLDAANPYSYVSGSTNWNDLSRTQASGSLANGPTFNTGSAGNIITNGVNQYIDLEAYRTQVLSLTSQVSFDMTIKMTQWVSNGYNGILTLGRNPDPGGGTQTYLLVYIAGYSGAFLAQFGNSDGTSGIAVGTGPLLPAGVTYNFTITYNAGTIRLYQNGSLISTSVNATSTIYNTNQTNFFFGGDARYTPGASGRFFNGNLYNLKIYNRALSATEVLQNFNATKTRFGL